MKKILSIIIPVFNNCNFTKSLIMDLIKLDNSHEIIIVDNGSTDNTEKEINDIMRNQNNDFAKVLYKRLIKNFGFGKANNIAYKLSSGENVLFLNNDVRVTKNYNNWTKDIINICNLNKICCMNGGLLNRDFEFVREGKNLIRNKFWYASGWCIAGSKDSFNKILLNISRSDDNNMKETSDPIVWNEVFFNYFEDVDLSWRLRRKGIEIVEIDLPLVHFGRMTGRKIGLFEQYSLSKKIFSEEWKNI